MFRLTKTYRWCRRRIDELQPVLLPSERFVLVFVFTEKVVRRVFIHIVCAAGNTAEQATTASKNKPSIRALDRAWKGYDGSGRNLSKVIGDDTWAVLLDAANMRDGLIHGEGHSDERMYARRIPPLLEALEKSRKVFQKEYGFSGWRHKRAT